MSLQPALHRFYTLLVSAILLATSALAQAQTKSYTVTAPDGVTLAVQEAGNPDGPAIVFIHGLLGSHLNWDAQVNSPLLQRYRMITYDLRGHGLSGKPSDAQAYADGNRWADDLAAVIKASHAEKPVLAGWSLGGVVISNYLARYGDSRIAGALYVNGVIELKPEQIVAHPEVYRDLNSTDLKTHLDTVRTFLALCFHTPPDTQTFERLFANAAMASWNMQKAVQSMTVEAARGLGNAKVPVLLLYGSRDALVQARPSIARATQLNPNVQSKLYEHSGHAPFVEEAERFNRDLAAFIDSTSVR
ncbi:MULTISPECIES: alpha/beta fold hydrolase [Pseudomonas]|uniref:Alpha/beta hydrolase n=1 Tax=Pseudomonas cichorii TaxID=36746 RepID=A0ABQ1DL02_PSECI|nr:MULTISPECIES: alpha/beta hydrolase [Pseudomonas]AHF66673.1 alpha/beta hydrolase fold family [Pseudomonas cichorii JBC1]QVE18580.1 alpha/beta hydrolase [Pseudomonas cichorii]SDO07349.1 Pimeloyl-ACP methyl ester carboxylesterase [Pseudomonas cichorii]GFM74469.1 alpha/beta hydrolase [Pseudomonas cichorii]GFM91678.1 alpha/beta hydrolase [Pseudomonas cichorii]